MKTRNLLLAGIITLSGIFVFTSCNKDDETVDEDLPPTETEAVDMVAYSLSDAGTTSDIETAAVLADEAVGSESNLKSASATDRSLSCGESADTTMVTTGTSVITYEYTKIYNYTLECDTLENPEKLDVSFSYDGEFDAPRLASTHSVSGNFEITQIEYTSDMYLINGTWQRSGGFESKIGNQANRQATIQFELIDVAVEKEPKEIDNGTIHFTMSGGSGRGSFNYEGNITFTGNGEAIIEISGTRYVTNLETGDVEEQ
ncbi:hypothetical protein [Prolixibacter sp. SD074]|uniref:hypothetical protein n=1 Tax=Prolixibacter sp. SD074 TaxID=2652391 RepID=UPI00126F16C0|nr:hypothetical protein [Prolixibacter sp. SD074]GET28487.1 hypothetical protein SD074_06890 [Prolixibacter sp. SD074]